KLQLILTGGFVLGLCNALIAVPVAPPSTSKAATENKKQSHKTEAPNAQRKNISPTRPKTASKNSRKKPEQKEKILITIDGGSATKKSPIAKSLSEKFDFIYLESGAIYRTVAYVLSKHKIDPKPENKQKIEDFLKNAPWKVTIKNRHACFIVDGEILSDKELRSDQLNATVALYSSQFESVQNFCSKIARKALDYVESEGFKGLIAEGRTCGTKTFPEADLKFWFNASAEAKIDFRLGEEKEVDDPLKRDALDKASIFAPLKEPKNAVRIWTYNRSLAENIRLVSALIEQKLDEKNELAKLTKK
ncbi:MAG: (d)CMP kinase, partial [Puniceicoccales bacterium]|nr:(d)CMP kinase [Puniceicoccales bacterium]